MIEIDLERNIAVIEVVGIQDLPKIQRLPKLAKRTALVIGKDVDYGIGRMWISFAEIYDAYQERQLFRDMDEAVGWLVPPQEV